ncbi:unnamed protein product [marine sediment metagenome]|uniref:Uncharacterized protein n=1 Tax=marine sediment metagenome TaxID=412755 RepID=X0TIM4_9ZZZZ
MLVVGVGSPFADGQAPVVLRPAETTPTCERLLRGGPAAPAGKPSNGITAAGRTREDNHDEYTAIQRYFRTGIPVSRG